MKWFDELNADGETYLLWYSINGHDWFVLHNNEPVVSGTISGDCVDGNVVLTFKAGVTGQNATYRFCLTNAAVKVLLESDIGTDLVKSNVMDCLVP